MEIEVIHWSPAYCWEYCLFWMNHLSNYTLCLESNLYCEGYLYSPWFKICLDRYRCFWAQSWFVWTSQVQRFYWHWKVTLSFIYSWHYLLFCVLWGIIIFFRLKRWWVMMKANLHRLEVRWGWYYHLRVAYWIYSINVDYLKTFWFVERKPFQ